MDVSNLTIKIQTSGLETAQQGLDKLGQKAHKAETSAQQLANSFKSLNTVIAGVASSLVVREFIKTADEMSLLNSRLKMTTSSMGEFTRQQQQMHKIARSTHSSIKDVTELYVKLSPALKNLGKSTEEVNQVTTNFTKALQLGGASAEESAAAIKQFAQAMGSGMLRGDEFNSMMEASPKLMAYMAKGMNVPIGKLRELGSQGKLTAEAVSNALLKMSKEIEEDFKNMPLTVGKATTDLRTELALLIDDFNKTTGATQSIANSIAFFADVMGENRQEIVTFAKHIGILTAATLTTVAAKKALPPVISAATTAYLQMTTNINGATFATRAFNSTLAVTKTAFKTFLPTAAIFAGFELLSNLLSDNEEKADGLARALSRARDELKGLTVDELERDLIRLQKEQKETIKNIEYIEYGLSQVGEEIDDLSIKEDAFSVLNSSADKSREKLKQVEDQIQAINEQLGILKDTSNSQNHFKGVLTTLEELEKKYEKVETEFSLYNKLELLKKDLAELDKVSYLDAEKIKKQTATRAAILKEIEKTEDRINNLNKKETKDRSDYFNAIREMSRALMTDQEREIDLIKERTKSWIEAGANAKKAREIEARLINEADKREANRILKENADRLQREQEYLQEYYEMKGDYEKAWQIERLKIEEQYQAILKKEGKKAADDFLKFYKNNWLGKFKKETNKAFKDIKGSWADTVSTMSKTVEDGFFNLFMRKTKDLKSALKDIGQNLFRDFMSPYARSLSQGIGGLFGSFLGGGSNLASLASFYGLSKSDTGSFVGEVAGTAVEIASDGTIVKGGSAFGGASNILSMASNLKSAYSMLTSGYTGMISSFTAPMVSWGGQLINAGYGTLGSAVGGFGGGVHGALTGSLQAGSASGLGALGNVGYIGGASLAGGALGYGVGTLGDRLFKANSYASSVGAVGGALGGAASAGAFGAKIGSMVGPWGAVIGAVAGALIGGMFGKKKAIGTGISVNQDFTTSTQLNSEIIRGYVQMQKKGWFSKKEWKDYHDLGADILGDISSQVKQMEKLALRAGAITGLTIKKGAYGGNSFSDTAITKAVISAMTGLDQEIWAEQISTTKKRKGFLGKLTNVYDKIMKYSPSTLANKATRPLDNALGRIMNKNGLGALHDQSIAGRVEIGDISDGKILDFEPTKKLEEKLGIIQEIQTKNMRKIVNPEIERMFKDWQEIAKKEKKNINEIITASLVSITDTYKSLALISQKNPLKQAQINIELMFEEFKDAAEGLKVEIPKNLASIVELSAEEMASAYRKAIANDFTKENIDGLNSLVKVYQEARKAQDDFTKSIISFTGQIANTQAGFYQSHGINTDFLAQQATYTKFRTLLSSLSGEISKEEKDSISKFGEFGNIQTWSKYLLGMSSKDMQGFMSAGNTELRNELIATITEYQRQIQANGGKEFWLKSFTDIENIDKQIAALKLVKQTEETLKVQQEKAQKEMQMQKEQLSILNLQKAAVEKIGNIAQRIRNQVIDRTTSPINYANALKAAKEAYARGDYRSKAFDNLSEAADHQRQYFEDTLSSYEEYRFSMLSMASEIEAISEKTTLADINAAIESLERELEKTKKTLDEEMKKANSLAENQIAALEQQRMQLIQNSQNEIKALDGLLGTNAPMVKYFQDILDAIINKDMPKDAEKIKVPEYTGGVENINTPATTANNALLVSGLDYDINKLYMSVLGRSADQAGLDFWKSKIESKELNISNLAGELIKAAIALTGSSQKEDWIAWYKANGYKAMADGGIVTRPTRALIGEAGYDEAVIPLKDGRGVKVDMDGGFELLSNTMNKLEQISQKIEKNTKELVLFLRGVISEDGEKIQAKVLA